MHHQIKTTSYELNFRNLPYAFEGYKIAQISDLHGRDFHDNYHELLCIINCQRPDIIVITGDLIYHKHVKLQNARAFCDKLIRLHIPIYFINGNHEDTLDQEVRRGFLSYLDNNGINVLNNEQISLKRYEDEVVLYGYDEPIEYYHDILHSYNRKAKNTVASIQKCIGDIDNSKFNILLAHDPIYFPLYKAWGADLVFSGHIHGGVINIPGQGGLLSPDLTLFPKYFAGTYEEDGIILVVSRGLNNKGIFSYSNPSEIVFVTLKRSE